MHKRSTANLRCWRDRSLARIGRHATTPGLSAAACGLAGRRHAQSRQSGSRYVYAGRCILDAISSGRRHLGPLREWPHVPDRPRFRDQLRRVAEPRNPRQNSRNRAGPGPGTRLKPSRARHPCHTTENREVTGSTPVGATALDSGLLPGSRASRVPSSRTGAGAPNPARPSSAAVAGVRPLSQFWANS